MVKSNPDGNFVIVPEWFYENHTVLNPGKCLCILIDIMTSQKKYNLMEQRSQVATPRSSLVYSFINPYFSNFCMVYHHQNKQYFSSKR